MASPPRAGPSAIRGSSLKHKQSPKARPCPPPPGLFEQRDVIREHYRLAEEIYGAEVCGRQMRKFGIKYSRLHPQSLAVRDAFVGVRRREDWEAVLRALLRRRLARPASGRRGGRNGIV